MKTITITEAKRRLGHYLKRAASGEEIGIVSGADIISLRKVEVFPEDRIVSSSVRDSFPPDEDPVLYETAFVETKRKLVDECDLWAFVALPGGVFSGAGAAVKTNLLFFTKGRKTEKIWYYDLTHLKVGKKSPRTLAHFGFGRTGEALGDASLPTGLTQPWLEDEANAVQPFPSYARLLPHKGKPEGESRYSWTVDFTARRRQALEEMQPHLEAGERAKAEAVGLN